MKRLLNLSLSLCLLFSIPILQAAELKDFTGKPQSIEHYAGKDKWLVVMIWASDCHVCNEEASSYELFHHARKDKDAHVLGISLDGERKKKAAEAFVARHQLSFPNLIGEPEQVMSMFSELTGVAWLGTPTFLIYDPSGKLVVQQVGAVPVNLIEAFIERNS
ncbi:MAG: TlpA family protein disulfide reductase [Gammaproteobacteria bacterium]|nr:TlpA family protein disulfide reductase [Gammaproteobacteria bacterium]